MVSDAAKEKRLAPKRTPVTRTQRMQPQPCLIGLGVPVAMVHINRDTLKARRRRSFWQRPEGELYELLELGRTAYRAAIKSAHPDRNGDHARAAEVNRLWARVRRLFKQRGIELAR